MARWIAGMQMRIFMIAVVIGACGDGRRTKSHHEHMEPSVTDGALFVAHPQGQAKDDDDWVEVGLNKAALGREFLLQASMIEAAGARHWDGQRSRVVRFLRQEGEVAMLESPQGLVVNSQTDSPIVLASMKIKRETENSLVLDFGGGMSRVFMAEDWYVRDQGRGVEGGWQSSSILAQYLKKVRVNEDRLEIRQAVLLAPARPVELAYYLSPYVTNEAFQPRELAETEEERYFTVAPRYDAEGRSRLWASKFDLKKPLVMALSANTPPEYRQAIKDGILYWNRALGQDVIQVEIAPEGVTAPSADHHVVQWYDWDHAGYAYADAQLDPRTGEILHAQIFIPSAFAVIGLRKAMDYEITGLLGAIPHMDADSVEPGLPRSKPANGRRLPCRIGHKPLAIDPEMQDFMGALAGGDGLQVAQDFIRSVIAHEMGHALGLRHNFAGSLASEMKLEDRKSYADLYIKGGDQIDLPKISDSVMDYPVFLDHLLIGRQIAMGLPALPYDRIAVRGLYEGDQSDEIDQPLFCTDAKKGKQADCASGDFGASPIGFLSYRLGNRKQELAETMMLAFRQLRFPADGSGGRPVDTIAFYPESLLRFVLLDQLNLLKSLAGAPSYLQVDQDFPYGGGLHHDERQAGVAAFMRRELKANGGLAELFKPLDEGYWERLLPAFRQAVQDFNEWAQRQEGAGFSRDEIGQMEAIVTRLVHQMEQVYGAVDLEYVTGRSSLANMVKEPLFDPDVANEYARLLMERSLNYLFRRSSAKAWTEEVWLDDGGEAVLVTLRLPQYFYSQKIRLLGAKVFSKKMGPQLQWAYEEKKELKERWQQESNEITQGRGLHQLLAADLSPTARRWLLEHQLVGSQIPVP